MLLKTCSETGKFQKSSLHGLLLHITLMVFYPGSETGWDFVAYTLVTISVSYRVSQNFKETAVK